MDATSVSHLSLYSVTASVPIKLDVRHSHRLTVAECTFQTIPWPGFYFHNVSAVSVVGNSFVDTAHKALVANRGKGGLHSHLLVKG